MNTKPGKKCEICNENDSKYKCPQCLVLYCSLNCYKNHKEKCKKPETESQSNPNEATKTTTAANVQGQNPFKLVDYEDEVKSTSEELNNSIDSDLISLEKLQILGTSDELKQALANKHLREILIQLNKHDQDIDKRIDEAMQEPLFQEFSAACLKLVQDKSDLNN